MNNERRFSQDQTKDQSITTTVMGKVLKKFSNSTNPFVKQKNILTFKHGRKWRGITTTESGGRINESELELKSAQFEISTSRIENIDLFIIDELIENFTNQFSEGFQESVFGELTKATEHRPPVELKLDGDLVAEVRKIWESIELDLNDDLTLSEPSLFLSPNTYKSLCDAIEKNPEQKQAIENELVEIKKRKHREALRRYYENILKYSLPDEIRNLIERRLREIQ